MKLYETLVNQLKKENNFVTDDGELKKPDYDREK
jgi:hypothetical protein